MVRKLKFDINDWGTQPYSLFAHIVHLTLEVLSNTVTELGKRSFLILTKKGKKELPLFEHNQIVCIKILCYCISKGIRGGLSCVPISFAHSRNWHWNLKQTMHPFHVSFPTSMPVMSRCFFDSVSEGHKSRHLVREIKLSKSCPQYPAK